METDKPLKVLFQHCADLLLPLTGDVGATVRSAGPAEIQTLARRADCVLHLEKHGEKYYRHIEFEDRPDATMARRCFEYNSQLIVQHKEPVLTTVIYMDRPKPKAPLVFRLELAGQEINRWKFDQICLWELDAARCLKSTVHGLVPLTPLMRGGRPLHIVEKALRRITETFPEERRSVAEDVLLALAGQHYNFSQLSDLVGRYRMMQSSLYTEGLADGEARGRVAGEREACLALVRKYHPAVLEHATPIIEDCHDPALLEQWILAAPDVGDEDFIKLLVG